MYSKKVSVLFVGVLLTTVLSACNSGTSGTQTSPNAAPATTTSPTGDAMKQEGDAMKKEGDAMKKEGDAMKNDAMKKGDAMKKEGDAMKK
jgi:hypothetical protein